VSWKTLSKISKRGRPAKKSDNAGKKKKGKKDKKKSTGGRGGTRSTGLDEEALAKSGVIPEGSDIKSIKEGGRDYVMTKLGEAIYPMRDSFIVAYLDWDGQKEENRVVPKEIAEFREKHGVVVRQPRKQPEQSSDEKESSSSPGNPKGTPQTPKKPGDPNDPREKTEAEKTADNNTNSGSSGGPSGSGGKNMNGAAKAGKFERGGKFAAMEKRKRDTEGSPKPDAASSSDKPPSKSITTDSKGRLVKVIDDDDEDMDCEFLNNRQLFLNLCQGNHYQFDQLRRAKHTSMMVLWHLHNRDAPKFVQQCAACAREILQGNRYHCPTCADYDQCYECFSNPNIQPHQHPLTAIPVAGQSSELTDKDRKERQRSIQLHMTLLLHAATCKSQKCTSANCAKMKGLLKHGAQCKVKATGGCNVCKRIWALLQIHAKTCKVSNCPVPNCQAIRERFRQITLQQQSMDDRRRQEMNRTYHSR